MTYWYNSSNDKQQKEDTKQVTFLADDIKLNIVFKKILTLKTLNKMNTLAKFSVIITTLKQTRSKVFATLTDATNYFDERISYYKNNKKRFSRLRWITLFNLSTFERVKEFDTLKEEIRAIKEEINSLNA